MNKLQFSKIFVLGDFTVIIESLNNIISNPKGTLSLQKRYLKQLLRELVQRR